jgi:hypothetical protein
MTALTGSPGLFFTRDLHKTLTTITCKKSPPTLLTTTLVNLLNLLLKNLKKSNALIFLKTRNFLHLTWVKKSKINIKKNKIFQIKTQNFIELKIVRVTKLN